MKWHLVILMMITLLFSSGCTMKTMTGDRVSADEKLYAADHIYMKVEQKSFQAPIPAYQAVHIEKQEIPTLTYESKAESTFDSALFPEEYTDIPGVLTFRGNHSRTAPAYGRISTNVSHIEKAWNFRTGSHHKWGGGAGWTGQPSIISWDDEVRAIMNVDESFKQQKGFTEVIYGSLDGSVYFAELETGIQTRPPIKVGGPIKGTVSIDPRGYPLLYVGQGIPESPIGYRIFSLIDGSELYFIPGVDPWAYRGWGAFDGAALINRKLDQLVLGGENGLFYHANLNTTFDLEQKSISVKPEIKKARYKVANNSHQGIENSIAVYRNIAYFADNGGSVIAINLEDSTPIFALEATDDTDATIVIDEEENHPFIYTGTEVDHQGPFGDCLLRKIDGITGEVIWSLSYPAYSIPDVNGGMLATPIVGKEEIDHLVIFTIARYDTINGGLMVAVNKETGEEEWRNLMTNYAWSSPVDVYTENGDVYILQADSAGNMHLISARSGEVLDVMNLGANVEASPAVYNNYVVVASRGGEVFGLKLN
ncbi:PQQ-binding-like beta-propeller repeat protein [Alkalihalophilus pseudofirmus]|uniref:outer membrane protein assembly factor BamB family protein n=1 Tax=Alkalihalophilus pseudofirmus TaxID=79885 RepID=UPI00259B8F67|nr:PQQ-binding-like beta-propeller repeat protein [Alkalihalophilus pseudofirmus]WEG17836.1 PQQ-binding-like beta-propeller repeat protein [Alkalihalophilus pseudofirmus]